MSSDVLFAVTLFFSSEGTVMFFLSFFVQDSCRFGVREGGAREVWISVAKCKCRGAVANASVVGR